jgi:hypothetical protein
MAIADLVSTFYTGQSVVQFLSNVNRSGPELISSALAPQLLPSRGWRIPSMPEKATIAQVRRAKRQGKAPSSQAGAFVHEEIRHVREGKHGARSAKQAIAIGLSKARRAGVHLPLPKDAKASTKRSAKSATSAAKQPPRRSRRRASASKRALKRESRRAASRTALARQAKRASRTRRRRQSAS